MLVVLKEDRSKVTVFPSLMAKVMVLPPLRAEALKVWLSVLVVCKDANSTVAELVVFSGNKDKVVPLKATLMV